jgi:hypothetical protein
MRLLLIQSPPGLVFGLEDRLTEAGHEVLTCYDDFGAPCVGITDRGGCPVDLHPEVAIVVHSKDDDRHESGTVCARRRHLSVVHVELTSAEADIGRWRDTESATVQSTGRDEPGHAEAAGLPRSAWTACPPSS